MKKFSLTLTQPRLSPAQKKRFGHLRDTVAGSIAADSEQSRALTKLAGEISKLTDAIDALESSGAADASTAQQLSIVRTRHELLTKNLAKLESTSKQTRTDKASQDQIAAFNTLSQEVAEFFRDYINERVSEFAPFIEPLWTGRNQPDPLAAARYFLTRCDLFHTVSSRFVIQVRDRSTGMSGTGVATRLVAIVDRLLSRKQFWADNALQTL